MKNNKSRVNPERQYSIGSASELLGLSPSTVRDLERRGQIECIRTPGGQRRISGAEILRLLEAASVYHGKQASAGDAKPRRQESSPARESWLGLWVGNMQQRLPLDASPEIRLHAASVLERDLRGLGPATDSSLVEKLVAGVVQRAAKETQEANQRAERLETKKILSEYAHAHLRRLVDGLPRRLAGKLNSPLRRHARAVLRDQLQDLLRRRLKGVEEWPQVREWVEEMVAGWEVSQEPRRPAALILGAAGLAGAAGGAAAAALSAPEIRASLKGHIARLLIEIGKRMPPTPAASATTSTPPADQSSSARERRITANPGSLGLAMYRANHSLRRDEVARRNRGRGGAS